MAPVDYRVTRILRRQHSEGVRGLPVRIARRVRSAAAGSASGGSSDWQLARSLRSPLGRPGRWSQYGRRFRCEAHRRAAQGGAAQPKLAVRGDPDVVAAKPPTTTASGRDHGVRRDFARVEAQLLFRPSASIRQRRPDVSARQESNGAVPPARAPGARPCASGCPSTRWPDGLPRRRKKRGSVDHCDVEQTSGRVPRAGSVQFHRPRSRMLSRRARLVGSPWCRLRHAWRAIRDRSHMSASATPAVRAFAPGSPDDQR